MARDPVPAELEEAAESYGYSIQRADTFTVSGGAEGIPPHSPFTLTAFGLADGASSPPIESHGSVYVIHLVERAPFDNEAFQLAAESINSRLHQEKIEDYIVYWYDKLKADSKIEDYRGNL